LIGEEGKEKKKNSRRSIPFTLIKPTTLEKVKDHNNMKDKMEKKE